MGKRKTFLIVNVWAFLLLMAVFGIVLNVSVVKGDSGTIYIRAEGSIDPPTAPVSSVDNVTYTLSGNIEVFRVDGIVVEKDSITVNGAGCRLRGTGYSETGIRLSGRNNVTIKNIEIEGMYFGILLEHSSNNIISGNNITGSSATGIQLSDSSDNIVSENHGTNNYSGIYLNLSNNNTVCGNNITSIMGNDIRLSDSSRNSLFGNNVQGIYPSKSSNNSIFGNNVHSIYLAESSDNSIQGNNITNSNNYGISLYVSSNHNSIQGNVITTSNWAPIWLYGSLDNVIFHNSFVSNTRALSEYSTSVWSNGYPSGGNYWSDYKGTDLQSGPYSNETGSDGIGDTPCVIDASNTDRYPLMGPFETFDAGNWNEISYNVDVASNSTVSDFSFIADQKLISFTVSGSDGTAGFCRATIPNDLLGGPYVILINDSPPLTLNQMSNGTHTFLYFTYNHSTQSVEIIGTEVVPEFPTPIILPLLMIITMLAIIFSKKRMYRKLKT